ncbi:MAG: hypothetical protein HKL85_01865 [Acidimicrobiaceae bacterium]|nr:hypothetical protein [Acidimicrobiaceae bacterium]
MDRQNREEARDTITVRPTLYWLLFRAPDYWAESARKYQWVDPDTPLADRPYLEYEASLDVTLGEVLVAACQKWGIVEGAYMTKVGAKLVDEFFRFGFVRVPEDTDGVGQQIGYKWPNTLPVVRNDGGVEQVPAMDVTFRELLVSSQLELTTGEVTQPYVYPVLPQGVPAPLGDVFHLTVEAVSLARANVDRLANSTDHVLRCVSPALVKDVPKVEGKAANLYGQYAFLKALVSWWRSRRKRQN